GGGRDRGGLSLMLRSEPQQKAAMVPHGHVRQPGEGKPALPPPEGGSSGGRRAGAAVAVAVAGNGDNGSRSSSSSSRGGRSSSSRGPMRTECPHRARKSRGFMKTPARHETAPVFFTAANDGRHAMRRPVPHL